MSSVGPLSPWSPCGCTTEAPPSWMVNFRAEAASIGYKSAKYLAPQSSMKNG